MKFVVNKSKNNNFKQGLEIFFEYSFLEINTVKNCDYGANIIKEVLGNHPVG